MKSELSFLIDLVLEDDLPAKFKKQCKDRIREVEKNYTTQPQQSVPRGTKALAIPIVASQSPSMQRLMAENPDLIPRPPVPVTAQAAQALAQRQALINGALNDKDEKRTSARKF